MRQLRTIENLRNCSLQANDGEIGKLQEIYFDDEHWTVRYFVVRTGGWLLGREVLIAPGLITGVDDQNRQIELDLTREQVEKSPPVETNKPVSRHYETDYYRYYGLAPYWTGALPGDAMPPPMPVVPRPTSGPQHPHLRSSSEVRGYGIHAHDSEMGEVADFIVDDREWKVRYVVIDTRKWLPGRKVLIAPTWIDSIDWSAREIVVDLDRETIQSAPPYDSSQIIGRDYELSIYKHYGRTLQDDGKS